MPLLFKIIKVTFIFSDIKRSSNTSTVGKHSTISVNSTVSVNSFKDKDTPEKPKEAITQSKTKNVQDQVKPTREKVD
jgi:hypothetical protein